ncbi:hypothetical protein BJ508DRAFT_417285 [Ascobolus immersus RN42]|uniref:Uncharacterized protein n=1 Tax=Ascobolus immersus RN42 TaxID=1160509 RepID=A0A3N4HYX6_ASCIM|nr:hypothetical protein BJ508DRAFT_417285 [Ascobolus immersus RN42]
MPPVLDQLRHRKSPQAFRMASKLPRASPLPSPSSVASEPPLHSPLAPQYVHCTYPHPPSSPLVPSIHPL